MMILIYGATGVRNTIIQHSNTVINRGYSFKLRLDTFCPTQRQCHQNEVY